MMNHIMLAEPCLNSTVTPMLSNREYEVLNLLAEGYIVKEIAYNLNLSPHTIISYKKNLYVKLKAKNTAHLLVKSLRMSIIE